MDSREAMASAALTAGWRWWGVDNREVMSQPETTERTDASDALLEILALRYNAPGGYSLSVGRMLTDTQHEVALQDLFGIRRVGNEIWIAEKHHGLQAAMSRSKWASADLRKLLLQMDGVSTLPNGVRFGPALRTRAIVIPAETLAAAGIDLGEYATNEATAESALFLGSSRPHGGPSPGRFPEPDLQALDAHHADDLLHPTMSIQDIASMPLPTALEEHARVFLWVVHKHLADGLSMMAIMGH